MTLSNPSSPLVAVPAFILPRAPNLIVAQQGSVIMKAALTSFQDELMSEHTPNYPSSPMRSSTIIDKPNFVPSAFVSVDAASQLPMSLEVEVSEEDGIGRVTLHSTIPNGFAIVDNEVFEGKKIIATKHFKKGDLLYIGYASMLDLSTMGHGYKLRVYAECNDNDAENFPHVIKSNNHRRLLAEFDNSDTHSVDDYADGSKSNATNKRQVYGWDSFMNHSCDANSHHPLVYRTATEMCYKAIALMDIDAGMEVTCDYACFDYYCNGHEIEVCACGSSKCRGKMMGFQGERCRPETLLIF